MDMKRFDSDPDPNLILRLESTTDVEPVYALKLLQQAKLGQLYLFSMYFTKLSTQFGSGSEETKSPDPAKWYGHTKIQILDHPHWRQTIVELFSKNLRLSSSSFVYTTVQVPLLFQFFSAYSTLGSASSPRIRRGPSKMRIHMDQDPMNRIIWPDPFYLWMDCFQDLMSPSHCRLLYFLYLFGVRGILGNLKHWRKIPLKVLIFQSRSKMWEFFNARLKKREKKLNDNLNLRNKRMGRYQTLR